ncbi:hypothetical protein ACLOJK_032887 [Asimina triloba]
MEDGLLRKDGRGETREEIGGWTWGVVAEESKKLGLLAGPMVTVTVAQYLLQVISLMMVGHLGELSLSSAAIATSLAGVTGFSVLVCRLFSRDSSRLSFLHRLQSPHVSFSPRFSI